MTFPISVHVPSRNQLTVLVLTLQTLHSETVIHTVAIPRFTLSTQDKGLAGNCICCIQFVAQKELRVAREIENVQHGRMPLTADSTSRQLVSWFQVCMWTSSDSLSQ